MRPMVGSLLTALLLVASTASADDALEKLEGTWISQNFTSITGTGVPERKIVIRRSSKMPLVAYSYTKVQRVRLEDGRKPFATKRTVTEYTGLPCKITGDQLEFTLPDTKELCVFKLETTEKGPVLKRQTTTEDGQALLGGPSLINPFHKVDEKEEPKK